jgi:hypothetical protein
MLITKLLYTVSVCVGPKYMEFEIHFLLDHENKNNYNKHKKYKITI